VRRGRRRDVGRDGGDLHHGDARPGVDRDGVKRGHVDGDLPAGGDGTAGTEHRDAEPFPRANRTVAATSPAVRAWTTATGSSGPPEDVLTLPAIVYSAASAAALSTADFGQS
jgi:hypothetical protein